MSLRARVAIAVCCGALAALPPSARAEEDSVAQATVEATASARLRKDIPATVNRSARHLIYLHGKIIEDKGIRPTDPKFGTYEYLEILKALEQKGFVVITESRPKDTNPVEYSRKVVKQIKTLLNVGVPADRITVVGASKGSVIAMLTSTALKNRDVNFVRMANCNDWVAKNFEINLHGNVLSIYDMNDEFGRTCEPFFDKATGLSRRKEVELKIGSGHAVLYQPLPEWIDLVDEWSRENAS